MKSGINNVTTKIRLVVYDRTHRTIALVGKQQIIRLAQALAAKEFHAESKHAKDLAVEIEKFSAVLQGELAIALDPLSKTAKRKGPGG